MAGTPKRAAIGLALLAVGYVSLATAAWATDWVDMGPLAGTGNGHVWSKVLDETGRTEERAESWSVTLPAPAVVEVRVRCADPYPLQARVQSKSLAGDPSEYDLDRGAGGFHKKFSSPWDPRTTRDIRVQIWPRQPGTDQQYQLTVDLFDAAGRPLSGAGAAGATSGSAGAVEGFLGSWSRTEGGRIAEIMEIVRSGSEILILFRGPGGGPVTSRLSARMQGSQLVASSAQRKLWITRSSAGLAYASSQLDGSGLWQCTFVRH